MLSRIIQESRIVVRPQNSSQIDLSAQLTGNIPEKNEREKDLVS